MAECFKRVLNGVAGLLCLSEPADGVGCGQEAADICQHGNEISHIEGNSYTQQYETTSVFHSRANAWRIYNTGDLPKIRSVDTPMPGTLSLRVSLLSP